MDKETVAEYKGLVAFVDKRERERVSQERALKFKSKIKNFYDSHALKSKRQSCQIPDDSTQDPEHEHEHSSEHSTNHEKLLTAKAFAWPLDSKLLKIKPRQSYRLPTDMQLAESLESTSYQQMNCYFPDYLASLDLKEEEGLMQQLVKSTVQTLESLLDVPLQASIGAKKKRRRSSSAKPSQKASRRKNTHRTLLNWQDILDNAQTAGWPSAVIERARTRLTSYYHSS